MDLRARDQRSSAGTGTTARGGSAQPAARRVSTAPRDRGIVSTSGARVVAPAAAPALAPVVAPAAMAQGAAPGAAPTNIPHAPLGGAQLAPPVAGAPNPQARLAMPMPGAPGPVPNLPHEFVTRVPLGMDRKYAGEMDLMEFWREFQDVAAINMWTEVTARRMFPRQLKKAARTYYDDLRATMEAEGRRIEEIPLNEVIQLMATKFMTEPALDHAKEKLASCKQKENERIMDYEARFKAAARKAGCRDGPGLAYRFFRNIRLRNIPLKSFQSIAEVTQFAKEYEDAELARGRKSKKRKRNRDPSSTSGSEVSSDDSSSSSNDQRRKNKAIRVGQLEVAPLVNEAQQLREIILELRQTMYQAKTSPAQTIVPSVVQPVIPPPAPQSNCQICGRAGHIAPQCFQLGQGSFRGSRGRGSYRGRGEARGRGPRCYSCQQYGHIAAECQVVFPDPGLPRQFASNAPPVLPLAPMSSSNQPSLGN
jgi:hypothetical protein